MRRIVLIALIVISANCFGLLSSKQCTAAGSSATTATCTWGTASAEGQTLLVFGEISTSNTATVTGMATGIETQRWNIANSAGTTATAFSTYLTSQAFGHASAVASFSTGTFSYHIQGLSYANVQDVIVISAAAKGSSNSITPPAVTTTCTNTIVGAYGVLKATSPTLTVGTGYTQEAYLAGGTLSDMTEDLAQSAPGTYTPPPIGSSVSGEWQAFSFILMTTTSVCPGWPVPYRVPSGTANVTTAAIGADQGMSTNGSKAWWTACYPSATPGPGGCAAGTTKQWTLAWSGVDANNLPTGAVSSRITNNGAGTTDCANAAYEQLNGVSYRADTGRIYVGATNYPADSTSCIIEYTASDPSTGPQATHTVGAYATEGAIYVPFLNMNLVYYFNRASIDLYDTSWSLLANVGMPVFASDAGANSNQSFIFDPQNPRVFYANPHCNNADHNVYVYYINGTTIQNMSIRYLGKFAQYSNDGAGNGTCQNVAIYGNNFYWTDRTGLDGPIIMQPLSSITQSNWWSQ